MEREKARDKMRNEREYREREIERIIIIKDFIYSTLLLLLLLLILLLFVVVIVFTLDNYSIIFL